MLLLCLSPGFFNLAEAQRYSIKIYNDTSLINDTLEMSVEDAVSKAGYLKFKLTCTNRSGQTMIYKPGDMQIRVGENSYHPHSERTIYILPGGRRSLVIDLKGRHLMEDSFFIQQSGLYFESPSRNFLELEDFEIPGQNESEDSLIRLSVKALKRLNKTTFVKFNVSYRGSGILKIEPGQSRMKVPKGTLHEADKALPRKVYLDSLEEDAAFSLYYTLPADKADLQTDPIVIEWRDSFSVLEFVPVDFGGMRLSMDRRRSR